MEKPLPYESMTVDEIKRLPVGDLADPSGAFLWLWTTNRYLRDGFDVMTAWGFAPSSGVGGGSGTRNPMRRFWSASFVVPTTLSFVLFARRGSITDADAEV